MVGSQSLLFAGFALDTDIPLTALNSGAADSFGESIQVRWSRSDDRHPSLDRAWDYQWLESDGSLSLRVLQVPTAATADSGSFLLQAPDLCDFTLDPIASSIAVDPAPELASNTLEHLLLDQAIPRLLARRGHLVVHASLVRIGGQSIAFIGRSGWGKSTTAALFHRRGHLALCDDCALFDVVGGQACATPSYPGLRLYADSIDSGLAGIAPAGSVSDYSDKQRIIGLDIPNECLGAQPLAAIYLLDDPEQGSHPLGIEPLNAAAACMALIEHSFRLNPADPSETVPQLQFASAVARTTPAFQLHNPRNFGQQDALIACILNHLDQIGSKTA